MKKKIWLTEKGSIKKRFVYMSFEEVREHFEDMIYKKIRQTNNRFIFNPIEEDDFKQELEIELWRAYQDYDPSTGYCFSTYLEYKLRKGVRRATFSRYSKKNQHNGIFSINSPINDDGFKIEDMLSTSDTTFDNIAYNELLSLILSSVKEDEIEALKVLLDRKEYSISDYAQKFGITRQGADKRVRKLRNKLRKVISKKYLGIA